MATISAPVTAGFLLMLNLWCILSDIANVEQLKEKIIIAFATLKLQNNTLENVRRNLIRRAELCMQQRGHHFQRSFKRKKVDILCVRARTIR